MSENLHPEQEEYPDATGMTDEALYAEYAEHCAAIEDIGQQLRDEWDGITARGGLWQHRAGIARRHIKARRAELQAEIRRREAVTRIEAAKITAADNAARIAAKEERRKALAADTASAQDRAISAKAARIEASEKRTLEQQALFCMACAKNMSKEQYRELWDKARDMFPDHPSWTSPV